MDLTDFPIFTFASFVFQANAYSPIVVTESGISMLVRLVQSENALSPIVVKESESSTLFSLSHQQNAVTPIVFTEDGSTTLSSAVPKKADDPIVVTDLPKVTFFRLSQANASRPIVVPCS